MDTDMDLSPPIEPTTELAMELEENDPRRDACLHGVLSVFPDIDLAHLNKLALDHSFNQDWVMSQILDDQDEGKPYPKQPQCAQTPKRKKPLVEEDPIEAKRRKYDNPEHRMQQKTSWYSKTA
jgi:TRIAD3 protein (E3 ubiquitin-protein ligase RNF216)